MSINWVNVLYVVLMAGLFGLTYWSRRKSLRGWIRDLAHAVRGAAVDERTIEGTRDQLRFRIRYIGGFNSAPLWHLEFPEVSGPSFALRVESGSDRRFKKLGFVRETSLEDPALDRRHLIASNDPDGLTPFFRGPAILAALKKLWPENERDDAGTVRWIQSGDGLAAVIDVSAVSEATFDERIDVLVGRVAAFALAVQQTPAPQLSGPKLKPAALDFTRDVAAATIIAAIAIPVLLAGSTLYAAFTWTGQTLQGRVLLGAFGVGLVIALMRLVLARGKPDFHRRVWQAPAIVMVVVGLGCFAHGPLNRLEETAPKTEIVKVVWSAPEAAGIFEVWEVELEGIGEVVVPEGVGQRFEKDQQVQVTWTRGYLGAPRLLAIDLASGTTEARTAGPTSP